ncbi:gliding motility-associated C-terminal domain-containing protein [Flavobacterium sp. CF108]|uniref:Ig-like domain-containing protein n=1 Tax=unclassified Flavobacterium TaxID=196869 RepID=UPI0008AA93F3|nr:MULTISPECIES: T9SS type B sorting domain-containing protein [unclassified Flavobacterium]SEP31938.1 gliding motility-associated C-terminal domain-containing protein [Flavobacterium sp. fv08]SHI04644.1 gliding motility-associated C-terminal domain-containing protein [Flavobacterium sp. CF108]
MKTINFLKPLRLFFLLLFPFAGFAQYTSIPDANFERVLITLGIDNGAIDGQVLTANINSIKSLEIRFENVSSLSGIEDFSNLETLICNNNNLTALDISKNTKLTYLDCHENHLTSLDVSMNYNLKDFSCNQNNLTVLDISKNLALENLGCSYNQLQNLDISKNAALKTFYCTNNQITNLDTSNNVNLNLFVCYNNQLTSLDISKNLNINMFSCSNNKLTSLDISANKSLNSFQCANNDLTTLNLKNGINNFMLVVDATSNPNLKCIEVDNAVYSNANWLSFKDATANFSNNCNKPAATTAPIVKATGDQLYCPQNTIKIVTSFTITHDPAETATEGVYIQISSGYSSGLDQLALSNPAAHPNVTTSWDATAGKLSITSPTGANVLYSDLVDAVKDVVYSNSSASASGTRTFSITIGNANYLPSTQHFYLFVPSIGITWTSAKAAAEASTYYGLKGYLATILSADEAQLIGEQASGTGWIGGSDAETEGLWKWVTGPETGTIMNYTFWNSGEPNNLGEEDYAHITQPGIGIRGSWNDLSNTGSLTSGDPYQPKGYVVEYGGMPGEAPLEIAASTKITIPVATPSANPNPVCDSGSFTFTATATAGATISWYDAAVGGNLLGTGNTYTTPTINTTTTYYVDAGCESNRKSVTATVNMTPTTPVAGQPSYSNCGPGSVTISAASNIGTINWFTTSVGGTSVFNGSSFTTPIISANTTYYAEASNSSCINPTRTPVNIEIYTPPVVHDESFPLCQSQTIILDAGVSGMGYAWSNGDSTQTTPVSKGGTYTVIVTSPEGCPSTKTIIVEERPVPEIDRIDVSGTRVVIYIKKQAPYFEFSVDGVNFQDSNVFYDVPGGLQTAYVREKSGCGGDTQNFVVLVFPAFFTPNGDTHNDLWEVTGMENYPQAEVTIFDRYGKLIAQLNASNMSWDGTFERTPLPSSDYWYALKIDNTKPILRGHFSLMR